jgi:signal recognition particle subunit SRP68
LPLIDRLDLYYEDPDLATGKANLVPFPPAFTPIPCKPLFFDLAQEHLSFPNIDDKMAPPGQAGAQGAGGGWLGGWLGWGSKKK